MILSIYVCVLYAEERAGSTAILAVEDWIEIWIVVHLHLAIKFKAAFALDDLCPKALQTEGKVGALFFEEGKAAEISFAVSFGRGVAVSFFAGVIDLQGEDGETIEDEAGGLGVEGGRTVLVHAGVVEPVEEPLVHLFDEIVAALIEGVDGVLVGGYGGVGGGGVAGQILFVPEVEVGSVVLHGELAEVGSVRNGVSMRRAAGVVPVGCRLVMQSGNYAEIRHTVVNASINSWCQEELYQVCRILLLSKVREMTSKRNFGCRAGGSCFCDRGCR